MKNLSFLFCLLLLVACDPDDGGSTTNFSYFPLTASNSWDYKIVTGTDTSDESLTVGSVSGNEFTLVSNPTTPVGLMTRILSSGTLKAESGKLIGNGSLDFGLQGLTNFDVTITDGILYDQNANVRAQLYTTSGTTSQTVQGFDLDIDYTVRTVQQASLSELMVEGVLYEDVIHSQLIVNATVATPILGQSIAFLNPQDVIVIDNYWAKDVGLIKSDNQLDYMLEDFSAFGIMLPIPQSARILTVQSLTTYTVN